VSRAAITTALVAGATVVGFSLSSNPGRTVEAAGEAIGAGGEYHALTPVRILDTRDPALDVAPFGRKPFTTNGSDGLFHVPVVGKAGLPAFSNGNGDCADDNVLAVAVNITVVNPGSVGYLEAFGKGESQPPTSILNFKAGEFVANTAILRPGCDGELAIRLAPGSAASADVLIDVFGWFSSSTFGTRGARLEPSGPGRIFDSRENAFESVPFAGGESLEIPIRGARTYDTDVEVVPNSADVVGVLVNLTGVSAAGGAPTFLSLLPAAPSGDPDTSNLNLRTGQVRSNLAIVPLSPNGSIHVYNKAGNTHVILDVMGYFVRRADDTTRGRVIPLVSPFRAFDTREPAFFSQPLPPANAEDWSFNDFVNDVKVAGTPVGAQLGLIGNLTAAGLGRQYSWAPVASYLTAYPTPAGGANQPPPLISNLGMVEGELAVPNMVVLAYGAENKIRFYNRAGYMHYLLDVSAVVLA
jgi:hypothetical protein